MAKLEPVSLSSTMLTQAQYDPAEQTLDLTMANGNTYTYEGVPDRVYQGLINADSPGRFYHTAIKGIYD